MWHLGSLFYHNTQYSQRGWYITNLRLCDIPRNKVPHTGPRHIWFTVCPFFGCEKNTDGSAVGLIISLAIVCDVYWGLLLLFLFYFFLKLVYNIASLRTWFRGGVSNQNFEVVSATRISLVASSSSFILFPVMALRPTILCLVYTICDGAELQKHYI
jgi:hypothetical protein